MSKGVIQSNVSKIVSKLFSDHAVKYLQNSCVCIYLKDKAGNRSIAITIDCKDKSIIAIEDTVTINVEYRPISLLISDIKKHSK